MLLAPPASPHAFTRYFAQVFGLSERTRAAMQRRIEAREGILMPLLEPAAVGPRIRQPTLVVHDRDDRVNRFADGVAYRDAIAGARLIATQGLGHRAHPEGAGGAAGGGRLHRAGPERAAAALSARRAPPRPGSSILTSSTSRSSCFSRWTLMSSALIDTYFEITAISSRCSAGR